LKTEAPEAAAQTLAMQRMADWIRGRVPAEVPITFAGNLMTLEFYLQRHQFHTTPEQAARLLSARTPFVCAVGAAESEALRRALPAGAEVQVLAREPAEGAARVELLSNRPTVEVVPAVAVGIGPLAVELTHSRLWRPQWYALDVESRAAKAEVRLRNLGSRPVGATVCWRMVGSAPGWGRVLAPGDTWTLDAAGEDPGRKRREAWREQWRAFEETDRTNPPPHEAMLFVGSSTIRLWSTLEADFPAYLTVRRGIGGAHLEDVTAEADPLIFRHTPRLILVYAGDNDLADGKTPDRVADDFETLRSRVRERLPEAFLGFLAIKPSVQRRHLLPEIRAANALVREFVSRDPRLFYVDVFSPMLGVEGEPKAELLAADGLHLSAEGYRVWAATIQAALQRNPALAGALEVVQRGKRAVPFGPAQRP
jgi:lysophospholipase L1-like esterase